MMKILVLNAGSSTQKSCLYQLDPENLPPQPPQPLWEASIDWTVRSGQGLLKVEAQGRKITLELSSPHRPQGIKTMLDTLVSGETKVLGQLAEIEIVGHRVVHGGRQYSQAAKITPAVKEAIAKLIPLAPNHNPAHLEGIELIEKFLGDVPQVAVFDTAFHTTIPEVAKVYPIPYQWYEQGIQRYGFHGISHQYVAHEAAAIVGQPLEKLKMITCHLGNGCSITAIKEGKSINTSMGFTPLEGAMMGTRSGSIDPAIIIHLMDKYGYSAGQINTMLNQESGLVGVSGISADMRTITQAMADGDAKAKLAFEIYIHRLNSIIGSMIPSLGGLDVLVFTAGIGENAAQVREKVCQDFGFLGLKLDLSQNASRCWDRNIATSDSQVQVVVVHTQEDWAIARQCLSIRF